MQLKTLSKLDRELWDGKAVAGPMTWSLSEVKGGNPGKETRMVTHVDWKTDILNR